MTSPDVELEGDDAVVASAPREERSARPPAPALHLFELGDVGTASVGVKASR